MLVHCSTQHPSEMQHLVAHASACSRTTCRSSAGAWAAASAARSRSRRCSPASPRSRRSKLERPVKLRLDRDDDFLITGRRHCFHYEYEVGYDDDGRVLGAELTMVSRAGFSADLSGPVMTRAICHFDNAYWLPDVAIHGYSGKTNTQSNTAFRGFGGPQGAIAIENILDSIARKLGKDPLDVRRAQLLRHSDASATSRPYGQAVDDNIIHELVAELEATQRLPRAARRDRRLQRDQPGAQARPRADAASSSASRSTSSTSTRPARWCTSTATARCWSTTAAPRWARGSTPRSRRSSRTSSASTSTRVRVTATDTQKVANTSATAASTGSRPERQGGAGRGAPDHATRLAAFAAARHGGDAGRRALRRTARSRSARQDDDRSASSSREAYLARVQLWSDGFYATPGLSLGQATRCRASRSTTSPTARR